MSIKSVAVLSGVLGFIAARKVMQDFKLKSLTRVLILLSADQVERERGYFSAEQVSKIIGRQCADTLRCIEEAGFAERTGVYHRPRRLTPSGHRACAAFQAHYERLRKSGTHTDKRKQARTAARPLSSTCNYVHGVQVRRMAA